MQPTKTIFLTLLALTTFSSCHAAADISTISEKAQTLKSTPHLAPWRKVFRLLQSFPHNNSHTLLPFCLFLMDNHQTSKPNDFQPFFADLYDETGQLIEPFKSIVDDHSPLTLAASIHHIPAVRDILHHHFDIPPEHNTEPWNFTPHQMDNDLSPRAQANHAIPKIKALFTTNPFLPLTTLNNPCHIYLAWVCFWCAGGKELVQELAHNDMQHDQKIINIAFKEIDEVLNYSTFIRWLKHVEITRRHWPHIHSEEDDDKMTELYAEFWHTLENTQHYFAFQRFLPSIAQKIQGFLKNPSGHHKNYAQKLRLEHGDCGEKALLLRHAFSAKAPFSHILPSYLYVCTSPEITYSELEKVKEFASAMRITSRNVPITLTDITLSPSIRGAFLGTTLLFNYQGQIYDLNERNASKLLEAIERICTSDPTALPNQYSQTPQSFLERYCMLLAFWHSKGAQAVRALGRIMQHTPQDVNRICQRLDALLDPQHVLQVFQNILEANKIGQYALTQPQYIKTHHAQFARSIKSAGAKLNTIHSLIKRIAKEMTIILTKKTPTHTSETLETETSATIKIKDEPLLAFLEALDTQLSTMDRLSLCLAQVGFNPEHIPSLYNIWDESGAITAPYANMLTHRPSPDTFQQMVPVKQKFWKKFQQWLPIIYHTHTQRFDFSLLNMGNESAAIRSALRYFFLGTTTFLFSHWSKVAFWHSGGSTLLQKLLIHMKRPHTRIQQQLTQLDTDLQQHDSFIEFIAQINTIIGGLSQLNAEKANPVFYENLAQQLRSAYKLYKDILSQSTDMAFHGSNLL